MNETEIIYEVTADDYYKYGKENSHSQKEFHPTVILLTITYFLFIFADLIYSYFFGALQDLSLNWLLGNIFIRLFLTFFLMLSVIGMIRFIVGRKKQEILDKRKNPIFCEHKLILTENEMVEITDLFTNRSSWKVIGQLKESESYLFFDSATTFIYLIPKRYFADGQQITDFRNKFNSYRERSLNEYSPSYFAILDENKN